MENEIYYNRDLSEVHHTDYGQIAEKAGEAVLEIVARENRGPGAIVDLGCGTGITARLLSEHGHEVIGVDYSAAMLDIARKNAPHAHFVQASLFDYQPPASHIILAIGEAINYLFDRQSTPDAIRGLCKRLYAALHPGGYLVCDVLSPDVWNGISAQTRIVETDQYSMFLQIHADRDENVLTREIILFYKDGECYRRTKEVHRQRLYYPEFIRAALEEAGFTVQVGEHYADHQLRKGHFAFFARKKTETSDPNKIL